MPKTVLVTGGTGFVGANLVRRLLRDGHRVHLVVQPTHADWRLAGIRRDVRLHRVAIQDPAIDRVVKKIAPDWIFHLAAHGAYSWQTDVEQIVQTNVVGTVRLVQACLKVGFDAFVNTGSSSEYGYKDHPPRETEWIEPNSDYAVAKAAATLFCRSTAQRLGVRIPTLRLYSVYGPWEEPGRLVPTLIAHALEGRLPPLVDPRTARDFVYVDDVCDAYVRAASRGKQKPGAVYNVGSGKQTTLERLVAVARKTFGVRVKPVWGSMENRAWDTNVWVSDPRAIRKALGWKPLVDLATGLARTRAWMEAHPDGADRYLPPPLIRGAS